MPTSATSSRHDDATSGAAFVIGVTGNMNPCGYTDEVQSPDQEDARIRALRQQVEAILDWIFADPAQHRLDPRTGSLVAGPAVDGEAIAAPDLRECWRGLGLRHTPVVVLSSLAPGVDTLVAETVMDYASRHEASDDPRRHVRVRAPLPFPIEDYRRATTFHPQGNESAWAAREARLDRLLARLRSQPGWDESRDLFCVPFAERFDGDPAADLEAVDPVSGRPRRDLRYRAAGEYVAARSDLLLGIHDHESDGAGRPESLHDAGAATIVAARLRGLTPGLLSDLDGAGRSGRGPVLRVAIQRGHDPPGGSQAGSRTTPRLAFLHPSASVTIPDALFPPEGVASADLAFRRRLALRDEANLSGSWLPEVFRAAGVGESASFETIQQRMDDLAVRAAPVARSRRIWLLCVAALSVACPLVWLSRGVLGVSAATAAVATAISALVLVGALWRLRWRGMQRTWARARLVAEVARSEAAVAGSPRRFARPELDQIPALGTLLDREAGGEPRPWREWRDGWIRGRLDGQLDYFRKAKAAAEKQRSRLTRWSTLFMDVMLALAVAGVLVSLSPRGQTWLRLLGGARLEWFLGVAGALLPLGLILTQTLRGTLDLNRRTARFARQISMLEKVRPLLLAARDQDAAVALVEETEARLLSEVVDWYFEAETAEQLFQVRERRLSASDAPVVAATAVPEPRPFRLPLAGVAAGGGALLFLARVILGRAPWALGASVGTLLWLAYFTPSDAESRSKLHAVGALIDRDANPWVPNETSAERGCIIIAHGLHGGVRVAHQPGGGWMRLMASALESRLRDTPPSIGLVDWHLEARPAEALNLDPGLDAARFAADVAGIRQQAREVGDFLAFRLSQLVLENRIRRDRPLHFIGHSAGGFLVARAALTLHRINLAPNTMRVTLLDTPGADDELLKALPAVCPVDFYITSKLVLLPGGSDRPDSLHVLDLRDQSRELSVLQAHAYASRWFIDTISTAAQGEDGFGRSPFLSDPGK